MQIKIKYPQGPGFHCLPAYFPVFFHHPQLIEIQHPAKLVADMISKS